MVKFWSAELVVQGPKSAPLYNSVYFNTFNASILQYFLYTTWYKRCPLSPYIFLVTAVTADSVGSSDDLPYCDTANTYNTRLISESVPHQVASCS